MHQSTWVVLLLLMFGLASYEVKKSFPDARNAPQVGQLAPQFTLVDTAGKMVSLADVLTTPMTGTTGAPKGVLLVFYRGYW